MKMIPTNDNVLVKREDIEEKKSPGGVHIPKTAQKSPIFCEVLAIGDMLDHSMAPIAVGDKVVVSTFAGVDIETDDGKFVMVKGEDILAVVKEEKPKAKAKKKAAK